MGWGQGGGGGRVVVAGGGGGGVVGEGRREGGGKKVGEVNIKHKRTWWRGEAAKAQEEDMKKKTYVPGNAKHQIGTGKSIQNTGKTGHSRSGGTGLSTSNGKMPKHVILPKREVERYSSNRSLGGGWWERKGRMREVGESAGEVA